ncbi:MAG: hypothetical protein H6Q68_2149 [Firmicutes bacterium]|nr:hypothetical protein [Bacillota bacterium]
MKKNSQNLSSKSFINRANMFFGDLLNATYDCIWLVDKKTKLIVYANYACEKRYSYRQDDFIGMPISSLNILGNESIQREMWHIDEKESEFHTFEAVHLRGIESTIDVEVISKLAIFNGREYYLSRLTDITERIRAQDIVPVEKISNLNYSGCHPRAYIGTTLYRFLLEKFKNCELGLIFIEIDTIRKILNKFGRQYKIFVEEQIEKMIYKFVQKRGYFIHLGEGEFLAILLGYEIEETRQVSDCIKRAIEGTYFEYNKQVFTCSVSVRLENGYLEKDLHPILCN